MTVRASKTRDARVRSLRARIAGEYACAVESQEPIGETFARCLAFIASADVTVSDRASLRAANWASRDLVECLHAEWCLYIGEERVNGQSDRYSDPMLAGRFEWRGTGKPFYDRAEPELLNGRNGIAVRDAQEQTNA